MRAAPITDPFRNIRRLVQAPVQQMRSFVVAQPLQTHFRRATCDEFGCDNQRFGWTMGFDLTDPERRAAARWIRDKSGRSYTHELLEEGRKVVFTFSAGQRCFEKHWLPLERDPFMIVRAGDFRGNPTGWKRRHTSAESFVDDWSSDLDKLNTRRNEG